MLFFVIFYLFYSFAYAPPCDEEKRHVEISRLNQIHQGILGDPSTGEAKFPCIVKFRHCSRRDDNLLLEHAWIFSAHNTEDWCVFNKQACEICLEKLMIGFFSKSLDRDLPCLIGKQYKNLTVLHLCRVFLSSQNLELYRFPALKELFVGLLHFEDPCNLFKIQDRQRKEWDHLSYLPLSHKSLAKLTLGEAGFFSNPLDISGLSALQSLEIYELGPFFLFGLGVGSPKKNLDNILIHRLIGTDFNCQHFKPELTLRILTQEVHDYRYPNGLERENNLVMENFRKRELSPLCLGSAFIPSRELSDIQVIRRNLELSAQSFLDKRKHNFREEGDRAKVLKTDFNSL